MSTSEKIEDHCDICRQIREGCKADELNPQNCKLCRNHGFIGDVGSGPLAVCPDCPRGFRLKLWIAHEKRAGRHVPRELAS